MSEKRKNLTASVHRRLQNVAKKEERPFQEYFYYYSMECFLHRLSRSRYKDLFILKGGLMFFGWGIPLRRPTRDIDMQGSSVMAITELVAIVREICLVEVETDGMHYDPGSVRGEQIMETMQYPGIRVYFTAYLGESRVYLHLDVSFANVISPGVIEFEYPMLLGMPSFSQCGYPMETAIAEKLQAMTDLQDINDRMKDYFDIWLLTQEMDIQGETLLEAVRNTFSARRTALPDRLPTFLTNDFAQSRESDWSTFIKRSQLEKKGIPTFSAVIDTLRIFLIPILEAAGENKPFVWIWVPGAGWKQN